MRCHQVLTGACNASTDCFAVGNVLGVPFTVYATGCDLAILDRHFERCQIITSVGGFSRAGQGCGAQITCVDCSGDYGRVAAGSGQTVFVFDPVPLGDGSHEPVQTPPCLQASQLATAEHRQASSLGVEWHLSDTVVPGFLVHSVAWNLEGTSLLVGGQFLQLWARSNRPKVRVGFAIGDDVRHTSDEPTVDPAAPSRRCSPPLRGLFASKWHVRTSEPVHFLAFSRDGCLFATAAERDAIVKVWFSVGADVGGSCVEEAGGDSGAVEFDFIYLAHPMAVTGLQWRRTSKFMHRGSVANMLVTSCRDNICRVWVETTAHPSAEDTTTPSLDDRARAPVPAGLQTSASATAESHKSTMMDRLKSVGGSFHSARSHKVLPTQTAGVPKAAAPPDRPAPPVSAEPRRTLHFHLAVTINAEFDIPLVPSMVTSDQNPVSTNFMVHWLNNKELTYNSGMESLLADMDAHEQQQQQQQQQASHAASQQDNSDVMSAAESVCSPGLSSGGSVGSLAVTDGAASSPTSSAPFLNQLESRLASLNTDWEKGSDLIFSIHPVDGSFLVWTIDYLDQRIPCHRQAQVSFSSRIPQALPLGDAMTMSTRLCLFATSNFQQQHSTRGFAAPLMSMVSKHSNGSLNLWTIVFNDTEERNSSVCPSAPLPPAHRRFNTVLNVLHERRVCGHRFGVNSVICHPVLPLMLSTSHLSRPGAGTESTTTPPSPASSPSLPACDLSSTQPDDRVYTSELILWRVDPVGPLSRQGGLTELTRVNVSDTMAFSRVAWIPTLLPSVTLGPICNSPSACYIASDGRNLNIYQTVVDARSMLAEINMANRKIHRSNSVLSVSSDNSSVHVQLKTQQPGHETFRIVSQQSASRPGCVIHLDTLANVTHDGEHIQFLHVYQERLIDCEYDATAAPHLPQSEGGGGLHVQQLSEPFFVVLIESDTLGTMLHTWTLTFSTAPSDDGAESFSEDRASRLYRPVSVITTKVCTQRLTLPEGVQVVSAQPAAGHLSSAALFPTCSTQYQIVSICSDDKIRFWKCCVQRGSSLDQPTRYHWREWEVVSTGGTDSHMKLPGRPLSVSVAYSGRLACVYQKGEPFSRRRPDHSGLHVNAAVSICQCESTGGAEWVTEDTIELLNVPLCLNTLPSEGSSCVTRKLVHIDWVSMEDGTHLLTVGVSNKVMMFARVSSDITVANMKALKENQQKSRPILQKSSSIALPSFRPDQIRWMKVRQVSLHTADSSPPRPLQMTWVRDGVLIVGLQNEMHVYSQWKMPPLQLSADRKGHLAVCSIDYAETRNLSDKQLFSCVSESMKKRIISVTSVANLELLKSRNTSTALSAAAPPSSSLPPGSSEHQSEYMPYYGLFEAAGIACPVLPQYHPKQLMELLFCGKVKRVKAILAHVVRYVRNLSRPSTAPLNATSSLADFSGDEAQEPAEVRPRHRRMSVSLQPGSPLNRQPADDIRLDYEEVECVPPLPLWMLLAADHKQLDHVTVNQPSESQSYDDLFKQEEHEVTLEDIVGSSLRRKRFKSMTQTDDTPIGRFGPRESAELTQLLTHCHLPDLTSIDQLYLMALSDTVASLDHKASDSTTHQDSLIETGDSQPCQSSGLDSLDECGLRYILAMRNFIYLSRCLPPKERSQLVSEGLTPSYIVWGFHSESSEELLQLVPSVSRCQPVWRELQQLGVGWWLRNSGQLRRLAEQLAKTAYQKSRDPMDAALFYIAMKKKSVVAALYKQNRDTRKYEFFSRDFAIARNRVAAKKNAYQCLGKQNFASAAALFLLAEALDDCLGVILSKMKDLQLAMVVCRLYDTSGDSCPPILQTLLNREILGVGGEAENCSLEPHPDPFLRSMAYWLMKDYSSSLQTLLNEQNDPINPAFLEDSDEQDYCPASPPVFNFYIYLRTHPLILMQRRSQRNLGDRRKSVVIISDNKQAESCVTAAERKMYFNTAHAHYLTGCPTLALEVLSKLPANLTLGSDGKDAVSNPVVSTVEDSVMESGTVDWSQPVSSSNFERLPISAALAPVGLEGADTPLASSPVPQSLGQEYDWSTPVRSRLAPEPLQLNWDDDERQHSDSSSDTISDHVLSVDAGGASSATAAGGGGGGGGAHGLQTASEDGQGAQGAVGPPDVICQQLKFLSCLRLMTDLLGSGTMTGERWRAQLYGWLEREVLAVAEICHHRGHSLTGVIEQGKASSAWLNGASHDSILLSPSADTTDLEVKLNHIARKRAWLREHQALLRTLLSFCSLQGTAGGLLASVRMELILLLQELQQDSSRQQLISRLPFNTSIPLLSASVASNKTVVMDPVRHVHTAVHDLLHVICQQSLPPSPLAVDDSALALLKNAAVALSCCVYQSLCDNTSTGSSSSAAELSSVSPPLGRAPPAAAAAEQSCQPVFSPPSKWPGVTSLRALLARERDEDSPNLTVLLAEVFVSVFVSLLMTALTCSDCRLLYRLVCLKVDTKLWSTVFGGGVKKYYRSAASFLPSTTPIAESSSEAGLLGSINIQRMRLNMKLLGQFGPGGGGTGGGGGGGVSGAQASSSPAARDSLSAYREHYEPPHMSLVHLLLSKPVPDSNVTSFGDSERYEFDSDSESVDNDSDEDDEELPARGAKEQNCEHSDPNSYSWRLIRFACIKLCRSKINSLLSVAGLELHELPVTSPVLHLLLSVMDDWLLQLQEALNSTRAPLDYVPALDVDESARPVIVKYRAMLLPCNTPFLSDKVAVRPVKRLWLTLVQQEPVQDVFIRALFSSRSTCLAPSGAHPLSDGVLCDAEQSDAPIKILHKEQDSITAFCINQANPNQMVLSTLKDLQELDISLLLSAPDWLETESDFDSLFHKREGGTVAESQYLVVQVAGEGAAGSSLPGPGAPSTGSSSSSALASPTHAHSTRGHLVLKGLNFAGSHNPYFCRIVLKRSAHLLRPIMRHKVQGVRKLCAHPTAPVYMTGGQDGSVTVREWTVDSAVSTVRDGGVYAKVNRVGFNHYGNKFGVADNDGSVSLWQLSQVPHSSRPFYSHQSFNKVCADFVFVESSSLLASCGLSTDGGNVCLLDTLMSKRKCQIATFTCHESGASALVYSANHQVLISGGKRGDVCVLDLRRRQILYKLMAHENSAIRSMCLDCSERYLVTGNEEGDVKVFDLVSLSREPLVTYRSEHARPGFFKNLGHGVTHLEVDPSGRLFSCGADGSMKLRALSLKQQAVVTY